MIRTLILSALTVLTVTACQRSEPGNAEPASAPDSPWLVHGQDTAEQRHSPLRDINVDNVQQLGLAWSFDYPTHRGLEATPIVRDGVIYTTGSWSMVFAHEAITGKLIWMYDPQVPRDWAVHLCCDVVNRGVALTGNHVVFGTLDGRLIALAASTGTPIWETRTTDPELPYSITGAPRIIGDKIIIGNGGSELGVRGYVSAYSVEDGRQLWRFYTVPGNPEILPERDAMAMAQKTFSVAQGE